MKKKIGYDNLNEALASYTIPSNLKTRLIYYDLGKVNNIVYNGQYMLGTSVSEGGCVDFEHTGGTQSIEVVTDYPGGWEIDASSPALPVWLTMTPSSSLPTTNGQLVFNASNNSGSTDRSATVVLKAGRLTQALTIRQAFEFMFEVVSNPLFELDGTSKQIQIKANAPWTATLVSRGQSGKEVVQEGVGTTLATGSGTLSAEPIPFTTMDDLTAPSIFEGEAEIKVTLSSPLGVTKDYYIPLKCASGVIQPESNSYIVAPNGTPILIPVSRANKSMLGVQLDISDVFSVDLVWTDKPHTASQGVGTNGAVKIIQPVGVGKDAYLLVQPGSGEGNAVVCIKKGSTILWSWHIWVTSYAPSGSVASGTFMDRNLGAIGNTPEEVGTKGLLYQWGRKDPFPGSTTINGTTEPTLYSSSGTTSIAKIKVTVANNFANSVANPATFYYKTASPYDWYSNGSTQNDALWGPTSKTVYDPCPDGWRVPQNGVWSTLTTSNFVWNATTLGRTNASVGGFYPAAGRRAYNSGEFGFVSTNGLYWSASVINGVPAYNLNFTNNSINPGNTSSRANGFSVRCIKE